MLKNILICTFSLLLLSGVNSAEKESKKKKNQVVYHSIARRQGLFLEALLEHKKVKPIYTKYKEKFKNDPNEALKRTWEELSPETQEEIQEMLSSIKKKKKPKRSPASKPENAISKEYEGVEIGNIKYSSKDPALKKVEDFLAKRFDDAFYGTIEERKTKTKVVSHGKFLDIYETQVGKNIIGSVSSYCMDANLVKSTTNYQSPDECLYVENGECYQYGNSEIVENEIKENRIKNKGLLKKFRQNEKGENINIAYEAWGMCITKIKKICTKEYSDSDRPTKDEKFTKQRSCVVTNYMREARQNLIRVAEIKKDTEKFFKGRGTRSFQTDIEEYSGGRIKGEKNTDELTSITSSDFSKHFDEENELLVKKFNEECKEEKDEDYCKKFILFKDDKEKLTELLNEYKLRRMAMGEKIKKNIETSTLDNKEQLETYLFEEGYTKDEIEEMVASKEKVKKIKNKIINRYREETKGITESLDAHVRKHAIDTDKIEDAQTKIETISKELEKRPKHMRQLIHFSNVVYGFLSIEEESTDASGKVIFTPKENTAALFRELESYNNREPASGKNKDHEKHIEELKDAIKEAGVKKTKEKADGEDDDAGDKQLTVKEINNFFLNYDLKKKKTP